ncbi:MAG: UPF0182 family protein [Nocardioidaceae bacterium]
MSGIFDASAGQSAEPPKRTASRRPRALLPTLGVVVVLVVLVSIFVEVWTDRLWYGSLGFGSVFSTVLWTRVVLFVVFGLLLGATAAGNAYLAYRMRPILFADGYRNPSVERYQDMIDPVRKWVLIGLGVVLFLFGGASAAGQWQDFLLWRNRVPFGEDDVYFGKDVGFFVFSLPWYKFLVSFAFTVLIISLIVSIITHYLYGGIRLQAARNKIASGAQIHLSVLLGLFMLVRAVSYWLDRYSLATSGGLFTGVSYTDAHAALPSKNILAIIALICAVLFFLNVFRPGWLLPVLGFGLLILSAILIGGIWPAIVQRFQVRPSETDKEAPYIARNIEATRLAYDIDGVDVRSYPGTSTLSEQELMDASGELPGVRLIDPRLVAPAFEQLQQVRGFYTMPDLLDVDRYTFEEGEDARDVVIAVRELSLDGLRDDQRNWNNDHTVYTHGYGVVAAYGDVRGQSGMPEFAARNLPTVGAFADFEQRVYYGENLPGYSIVGAPDGAAPVELNIPANGSTISEDENTTYDGGGGVPVGSTFNQLLYSAKFWNSSILLSGRVNSDSKIMYDRHPRDMVEKVAPWLTVDGDPYPAVVDGRLLWIIDGYTTTDDYPMSQRVDLSDVTNDSFTDETSVAVQQSDEINYIRNSVKATVDAYDGTVKLYAWEEDDPMLEAWMGAFPDTVEPKSEISAELLEHLRYPEDLFKVQRELFSTYHVTDPNTFYGGSQNWLVPEDPTVPGSNVAQPPFYLTVKLPDQEGSISEPHFALTTVYVPQGRQNLASFMSVNADPESADYGKLTVLELPSDNTVPGPGQVANAMQNDRQVAEDLLEYKQAESQALSGNLLTLPIGDELFYVQPIYTQRGGTGSYPILQFVLTSIGDQVGIGTSFESSFADALGLSSTDSGGQPEGGPPGGGGPPGDGGTQQPGSQTDEQRLDQLLQEASEAFEDAQAALNQSPPDLGAYQKSTDLGTRKLEQALDLRQEMESGTSGGDGQSGDGQPADGQPGDGQPTESQPTDSSPTESSPTESEPTGG